jgi:2-polyprenyl-6-methoxyphenol hydroxylase-like FAD-dependent oxidoreductase
VTGVTQDDAGVTVTATGPGDETGRWRAEHLVAADGARSAVRDLLGVRTTSREYRDRYVMGDFADAGVIPGDTAVIDVGPFGVVESFPLPDHTRRFVAHTPRQDLDAAGLAGVVAARTGMIPDPATCSMLSAFGTRRRFASGMVHGRVVLVGDAAHEISPIGGQGMNLGWLDAGAVAPVLRDAVRSGGTGRAGVSADVAGALALVDRTRMRSARVAARQAELNTAAGRPARGVSLGAREALLATLLRSPASDLLARVYAMRFA